MNRPTHVSSNAAFANQPRVNDIQRRFPPPAFRFRNKFTPIRKADI